MSSCTGNISFYENVTCQLTKKEMLANWIVFEVWVCFAPKEPNERPAETPHRYLLLRGHQLCSSQRQLTACWELLQIYSQNISAPLHMSGHTWHLSHTYSSISLSLYMSGQTATDRQTDRHTYCCGQLWVWHTVCGQTCDGLYHFVFYLVIFGIPLGSLTIKPALARHTGVQRVSGLRQSDHVINLRVYMGCALALVFQVRSLYVPWYLVHFQGSISGSP